MRISVSMIIKNEEEMLPKCLKSVKGVDEIIIVDTGSTDKSIEIAEKAGAKVFTDYKWSDNFAEARNESKKHCTGDWLLIIDGDEILNTMVPVIRELLSQSFIQNKDAIMFKVDTGVEVNDQIRIFRNRPDVEWVGAAHNLPFIRTQKGYERMDIYYSTFKIKANFSPNHRKDPDRTLRIMTKEISKGVQSIGINAYTRYLYYLAREWLNRKESIKALYYLDEYVKIARHTNEMADAWFLMATCYVDLMKLENAVDACLQVVKYLPKHKAAWAMLHNLSHNDVKSFWERVFHMADNKGILFERKQAEKLIKLKK